MAEKQGKKFSLRFNRLPISDSSFCKRLKFGLKKKTKSFNFLKSAKKCFRKAGGTPPRASSFLMNLHRKQKLNANSFSSLDFGFIKTNNALPPPSNRCKLLNSVDNTIKKRKKPASRVKTKPIEKIASFRRIGAPLMTTGSWMANRLSMDVGNKKENSIFVDDVFGEIEMNGFNYM